MSNMRCCHLSICRGDSIVGDGGWVVSKLDSQLFVVSVCRGDEIEVVNPAWGVVTVVERVWPR